MQVKARVHVRSKDGAQTAVLAPGDTVPEWADVTNPDVVDLDEAEESAAEAPAPKRRSAAKAD